ncbi:hypothetical protein AVEN_48495-1 [Araneus ventricosus]|uniref:Uncharacterized protein n=1 Tax=Araneus ventricosus TaxID=182803 RepID=A0A4Y2F9I7_ARAVE|nr:hypothetical protein AVEN_48495-1 [Araneus ventricosus]
MHWSIKPRSYGLSFHEFRPRFALFPIVGTRRIDVARGLVSVSVVSRVMAVNSSHVKGGRSGQTASVLLFTRALPRDLPSHTQWERRDCLEFHRPQYTSTNLKRLEVCQATRRGTKLNTGRRLLTQYHMP